MAVDAPACMRKNICTVGRLPAIPSQTHSPQRCWLICTVCKDRRSATEFLLNSARCASYGIPQKLRTLQNAPYTGISAPLIPLLLLFKSLPPVLCIPASFSEYYRQRLSLVITLPVNRPPFAVLSNQGRDKLMKIESKLACAHLENAGFV